jgi:trk system potassium uptake protein TrkH
MSIKKQSHFSPAKSIMMGFLLLIAAGTVLLMLPISSNDGCMTSFWDALFTSTSAVCVTGLVIFDTFTHWSYFGQLIIILLIQIGGMGIVTMTIGFAVFTGKKIGLKQRFLMQESISAPKIAGIIKLTGFIFRTTFMFEAIGAFLLSFRFVPKFGLAKGIWFAIFHSISAFCNAGFDLMGANEKFSSLTAFSDDPVVCITVMTLIVVGGIGFFVWDDIKNNGLHLKRYRLHTKVALFTSLLLIIIPALYFFFYEFSFSIWRNMPFGERLLSSFFQSVTTRTAGFNTIDLTMLKSTGVLIMICLMLIGGSPGSTAGGFKTTTFALLILCIRSTFNKREHVAVFKRRVPLETLISVCSLISLYIILFSVAGMIICSIDGVSLKESLFEAASAIGTVGLSLGITSGLSLVSRIILILLMYFGRVGGLTMIYAVSGSVGGDLISALPKEKISIG